MRASIVIDQSLIIHLILVICIPLIQQYDRQMKVIPTDSSLSTPGVCSSGFRTIDNIKAYIHVYVYLSTEHVDVYKLDWPFVMREATSILTMFYAHWPSSVSVDCCNYLIKYVISAIQMCLFKCLRFSLSVLRRTALPRAWPHAYFTSTCACVSIASWPQEEVQR